MELGVGEALVSVLDEKGIPTVVDRAFIIPPRSSLSLLSPEERAGIIRGSVLYGHYEKETDRESAYEKLKTRADEMAVQQKEEAAQKEKAASSKKNQTADLIEAFAKSTVRAVGSQVGRQIMRGIFGSMLGGRKR
jgi:DNA helicase HerA-like ATPase